MLNRDYPEAVEALRALACAESMGGGWEEYRRRCAWEYEKYPELAAAVAAADPRAALLALVDQKVALVEQEIGVRLSDSPS